jgi:hypothetical protein
MRLLKMYVADIHPREIAQALGRSEAAVGLRLARLVKVPVGRGDAGMDVCVLAQA